MFNRTYSTVCDEYPGNNAYMRGSMGEAGVAGIVCTDVALLTVKTGRKIRSFCSVSVLCKAPPFPTKNLNTHQLNHEAESSKPQPQVFFYKVRVTDLESLSKSKT